MSKIRIESLDVLRSIEQLRARGGERMSVCVCVCGCNYDLEGYAPNEEVCGACLSACPEEVKEGEGEV